MDSSSRHCGVTYSTDSLQLHAGKDRSRERKKTHSWPGGRLQSSSAQVKTLQECVKEWGVGVLKIDPLLGQLGDLSTAKLNDAPIMSTVQHSANLPGSPSLAN